MEKLMVFAVFLIAGSEYLIHLETALKVAGRNVRIQI
jgi:hypothetical protein